MIEKYNQIDDDFIAERRNRSIQTCLQFATWEEGDSKSWAT